MDKRPSELDEAPARGSGEVVVAGSIALILLFVAFGAFAPFLTLVLRHH